MLILLLACLFPAYMQAATCNEPSLIYEELGCKPIYGSKTTACPIRYNCSHLDCLPTDTCFYKGKHYNIGEKLPCDEMYEMCRMECYCKEWGVFNCEEKVDCYVPFSFWGRPDEDPNCRKIDRPGKCCGKTVCPPFATCTVGNITYMEGDYMQSPEKCMDCKCAEGFNGKFIPPFCKKVNCGLGLNYALQSAINYCAPMYYNTDSCCPEHWNCEDAAPGEIIKNLNPTGDKSLQCRFKNETLQIGDKFSRYGLYGGDMVVNFDCICRIPPFVTCISNF